MNTSYRLDWSHISPSNLAVCLLTSASFPLSFSLDLKNLEDAVKTLDRCHGNSLQRKYVGLAASKDMLPEELFLSFVG